MKHLKKEPPLCPYKLAQAKREAEYHFGIYLRLRSRATIRKEEMDHLRRGLYQTMKMVAMNRATKDIRKVQAILGIENLQEGQGGLEFRARLSGLRSSPLTEIVRSLQKPLEPPLQPLPDDW